MEEGGKEERPDLGQRGGMDGSQGLERERTFREDREMKDKPGLKEGETGISLHSFFIVYI